MTRFIAQHFVPILAALILVSQALTVATTRRVAPLGLMMHPSARRFRTLADVLYLAFCAIPFYNSGLGVAMLIFSLLMAATYIRNTWALRAFGEAETQARIDAAVRRSTKGDLLWSAFGSAGCVAVISIVLFFLSPRPTSWGYWTAVGIAYYAIAIALTQSTAFYRAVKRNRVHA